MRKLCAILLGTSLLLGNISYAAEVIEVIPPSETILTEKEISVEDTDENIAVEDGIVSDISRLDEMLPAEKEDLTESKQRMVEEVVSLAETDALSAAESMNQISDEDTYEAALHEVLDSYYAEICNLPFDSHKWDLHQDQAPPQYGRRIFSE